MTDKKTIEIVDVTARDGLQNEAMLFTTDQKLGLIGRALDAGSKRIEVASFVHPKYVPQMADAEAVIAGLPKESGVTFIGLVLNERGVDRALKTEIDELGFVVAASDGFALKNQRQTRDSSVDMALDMMARSLKEGRGVNVTISTAFGCPFDGEVEIATVVDMVKKLAAASPREVAIADTIGVANPWHVRALISEIKQVAPDMPLRAHFHNTRNTGIANAYAAIEAGVSTLDVSIGGIGGCPFAPNATGNVPAEDVVYMLERNDIQTGLDLDKLINTAKWLSKTMGKDLPSMVSRAGGFPNKS